jgi:hypothetical protein
MDSKEAQRSGQPGGRKVVVVNAKKYHMIVRNTTARYKYVVAGEELDRQIKKVEGGKWPSEAAARKERAF